MYMKKVSLQGRMKYLLVKHYALTSLGYPLVDMMDSWGLDNDERSLTRELDKAIGGYSNNEIKEIKALKVNFINKIGIRKYKEKFLPDISKLLFHLGMGKEWLQPFADFLISGKLICPKSSLYLEGIEKSKKCNGIIVSIGPHTTLEDIKYNWKEIEKMKKVLWPQIKCLKVSHNSIQNLYIQVNELFSGSLNKETRRNGKTDSEKVIDYWPDAKNISKYHDKKRINNLRQIRKRYIQEIIKARKERMTFHGR